MPFSRLHTLSPSVTSTLVQADRDQTPSPQLRDTRRRDEKYHAHRAAGITSVVVVVEEGTTPPVLVVIPSVAPSAATALGWCDCLPIRGPKGVGEQREIRVSQREKGICSCIQLPRRPWTAR